MDALAGLGARFDHVAIAADSFERMLPLYRDTLGGVIGHGGTNAALGFSTLDLDFPDGKHVELLAPVPGSSFLDSFLRRSGGLGGLHHVTFLVDDIAVAVQTLNQRGYVTFGETLDDPAWSEAFVHPKDSAGVLLQVAQIGTGEQAEGWGRAWTRDDTSGR